MNNNLKQNLHSYLISMLINEIYISLKEDLDKLLSLEVLPNEH